MTEDLTPRWRKRVNISRSVKGVITFDATCERTDTDVPNEEVVAEIKALVTLLETEWPTILGE